MDNHDDQIELGAHVVSAYVATHKVGRSDLPALISSVIEAFRGRQPEPIAVAPTPAVSIKKSIHLDHLVCLEDGKHFKSLKRHLATEHGMTAEEYRSRWGLKDDYPMVAPAYAARRSEIAKSLGLGTRTKVVKAKGNQKRAKR